jgi:hypothetical protein
MTPSSPSAGCVRLYRAGRFPDAWSCVGELVERPGIAEPTVSKLDGHWWMFAAAGDDELRLYGADSLYAEWQEHPASPVVLGDRSAARPAGRVLRIHRQLVRFAQDRTAGEGTGVRARAIDRIDPEQYVERPLGGLLLGNGGHHVDVHDDGAGGWLAYVDGRG